MDYDVELKAKVENTFLKKPEASIEQPSVLAAMITAASQMANASDGITTPYTTTEELLDLYGKSEDGKVTSLLGMQSSYIKLNTGYSVEVEDMGAAAATYQAQQATYDEIYNRIAERAKSHEKESGKSL